MEKGDALECCQRWVVIVSVTNYSIGLAVMFSDAFVNYSSVWKNNEDDNIEFIISYRYEFYSARSLF